MRDMDCGQMTHSTNVPESLCKTYHHEFTVWLLHHKCFANTD